jgi:hypothetical protein
VYPLKLHTLSTRLHDKPADIDLVLLNRCDLSRSSIIQVHDKWASIPMVNDEAEVYWGVVSLSPLLFVCPKGLGIVSHANLAGNPKPVTLHNPGACRYCGAFGCMHSSGTAYNIVLHASINGVDNIHQTPQECGACGTIAGSTRADLVQLGSAGATSKAPKSSIALNLANLLLNIEGSNASLAAGQVKNGLALQNYGKLQLHSNGYFEGEEVLMGADQIRSTLAAHRDTRATINMIEEENYNDCPSCTGLFAHPGSIHDGLMKIKINLPKNLNSIAANQNGRTVSP